MNKIWLFLSVLTAAGCLGKMKPAPQSQASRFTPVLDRKMNFGDAKEYCRIHHKGLPTVRDFAQWSMARGAKGIISEEHVRTKLAGKAPDGCYRVASAYDDGSTDDFYFNHSGFQRPQGKMGTEMFWTLSTALQNANYAHVFYGEFGGGGGRPEEHHKDYLNSVVCLR